MDWDLILLDLILTMFFYLLVPVILVIRQKPMSKKQIKKVTIINGIVVWLVFSIILLSAYDETSPIPAAFFWSWIGKKIMERTLLEDKENSIANEDNASFCRKCGNRISEEAKFCNRCGTEVIDKKEE